MLEQFKNNTDVIIKETFYNCVICYQEGQCNILEFMKDLYPKIQNDISTDLDMMFPGICKKIDNDKNLIAQLVFSGIMVLKRNLNYYALDISKSPTRKTQESNIEAEGAFTARDGFVENFKENIALIRTRVKDSELIIDNYMVGRRSKTNISLLYINDIHDRTMKYEIEKIIRKIDVDAIISAEDLMIYFKKNCIFPIYQYVGSPDLASRRLLNGEFLIIIDRIAYAIVFPVTFTIQSRMGIDNMNVFFYPFFEKLFILLSIVISTIFLGVFCSFTTFQTNSLSLRIISILKEHQRGIILPQFIEIFVVLSLLELFYLIGFRQPKTTISSTVVLISGIIIGENLVESGIASVFVITFCAISFLMTFVGTSNTTTIAAISSIRLICLISSLYFGLFGVVSTLIILFYFLYNQKSLGVHYFYPFLPFDFKGIIKFFRTNSSIKNIKRDKTMKVNNIYKKAKNNEKNN